MKAFDRDIHVVPFTQRFETIEHTALITELQILNYTWRKIQMFVKTDFPKIYGFVVDKYIVRYSIDNLIEVS